MGAGGATAEGPVDSRASVDAILLTSSLNCRSRSALRSEATSLALYRSPLSAIANDSAAARSSSSAPINNCT